MMTTNTQQSDSPSSMVHLFLKTLLQKAAKLLADAVYDLVFIDSGTMAKSF